MIMKKTLYMRDEVGSLRQKKNTTSPGNRVDATIYCLKEYTNKS